MINALLKGVISLIIGLVSVVMAPIDMLLAAVLPDLSNMFTNIASMFNLASSHIGWGVSLSGLSSNAISMIILYYGITLTLPFSIYMVKLALKWYDKLKP